MVLAKALPMGQIAAQKLLFALAAPTGPVADAVQRQARIDRLRR